MTDHPVNQIVRIEDLNETNAPAVFGHGRLGEFVAKVKSEITPEVPDLTTKKGRDRIASLAAKVARSKTAVDGAGRQYLKKLKAMPKDIEAELREFIAQMDALRDEVRKPLTDWEDAIKAEEARIQATIEDMVAVFTLDGDMSLDQLGERLECLINDPVTAEVYGARLDEACRLRGEGIELVRAAITKREQYEAMVAENERLRAEQARHEQEERERAAAARAVAEEKERNRIDLEQREKERQSLAQEAADKIRDAELRAAKAIQDAEDAERRAKAKAEDERISAEFDAQRKRNEEARQEQARQQNKEHRKAVNNAALKGLVEQGLSADCAKQAIIAIASGKVPGVTIKY